MANVEIQGEMDLYRNLRKLGDGVASVMKSAVKAGARPILDDMRSRIHDVDGDLSGSLGFAPRNGRAGQWEGVRIGPQPPKGAHGHLVEYGHALVKGGKLGKGGKVIGNVPAHPFARPALKGKKEEAEQIIEDELRKAVEGMGL